MDEAPVLLGITYGPMRPDVEWLVYFSDGGLVFPEGKDHAILDIQHYSEEPKAAMVTVTLRRRGYEFPVWHCALNNLTIPAKPKLCWKSQDGEDKQNG